MVRRKTTRDESRFYCFLVANDNIIVFYKDNKTGTLGDSNLPKQLFFYGFDLFAAVTLLLHITNCEV
jgi:hypothetical protein